MLKGNNLILSINGTPLGAARTCSIDRNTDTIEVCSPVDGPARRFIPSSTGWSISAGGLYATREAAERLRSIWRKYQRGGVQTPLAITVTAEGGVEEAGQAVLTSLNEQGDHGSLVKFSIQLQGSGALTPTYRVWDSMAEYRKMNYDKTKRTITIVENSDLQEDFHIYGINITVGASSRVRVEMQNTPWPFVLLRGSLDNYRQTVKTPGATISAGIVAVGQDADINSLVAPGTYCVLTNWSDWADELPTITIE